MSAVQVRRHGAPILAPTERWWENGVTFNAAVTYLLDDEHNRPIIRRLLEAAGVERAEPRELVVVLYRGRPRTSPGYLMSRSYIGVALFTPQMQLIHRFPEPVLLPDDTESADDFLGVEDPRITRIGDRFIMVYCGCGQVDQTWRATLGMAQSSDLLHWEKLGPIDFRYCDATLQAAGPGQVNNKDGVLLPEQPDGTLCLLHRPMVGDISTWAIHLARSRALSGPWEDLGPIMHAPANPPWTKTWIGAGTVPLHLGGGRYLEIYHSGHLGADGSRLYTHGAAVLNLDRLDERDPSGIVESRLDHFMVPEDRWEIEGPYPDSVANVLFTCGAYERNGEIHILYGGGDTYVLAASVSRQQLLDALQPVPV